MRFDSFYNDDKYSYWLDANKEVKYGVFSWEIMRHLGLLKREDLIEFLSSDNFNVKHLLPEDNVSIAKMIWKCETLNRFDDNNKTIIIMKKLGVCIPVLSELSPPVDQYFKKLYQLAFTGELGRRKW